MFRWFHMVHGMIFQYVRGQKTFYHKLLKRFLIASKKLTNLFYSRI